MSVDGIILAAGFSERAKDFKPSLDIFGKPLMVRTIENMINFCQNIIIIGGHNYSQLCEITNGIPKIRLLKNENYKSGMFSSVRIGVKQVKGNRFFIIPGDQPAVRPETFELMLKCNQQIVIPKYKNKKGHPVLFSSNLISEILEYPDTEILRNYIHSKEVHILDVNDPGIGMDVDTPDDYQKVLTYYECNFISNES